MLENTQKIRSLGIAIKHGTPFHEQKARKHQRARTHLPHPTRHDDTPEVLYTHTEAEASGNSLVFWFSELTRTGFARLGKTPGAAMPMCCFYYFPTLRTFRFVSRISCAKSPFNLIARRFISSPPEAALLEVSAFVAAGPLSRHISETNGHRKAFFLVLTSRTCVLLERGLASTVNGYRDTLNPKRSARRNR